MTRRLCEVWQIGRIGYAEALDLQNRLANEPDGADRLLLLEHPHTYTLGSSARDEHLLMPPEERERLGIEVFKADRGGDITYHGPGQLVGYPIIHLQRDTLRTDFIGYVRNLEQVIIATLADYGIPARPIKGLTGVWVDTPGARSSHRESKIAAIGVRINVRAVTKHGFALNLNSDLSYFDGIIPCGIRDKGVTGLAALLGAPVDETEIMRRLIGHFGDVFEYDEMLIKQPAIYDQLDGG
ncbi:MAG: lipoyl(octanoyl) transferase LipB [Chloroflexota bacterium]